MPNNKSRYYIPAPSHWPIVGSIGLFLFALGFVNWIHKSATGPYLFFTGSCIIAYMMFGWFSTVIHENRADLSNNPQVNRSFRLGMFWFIFTEVMFFVAFFGTLFYARFLSVPWLAGHGSGQMTHLLLWPDFHSAWPVYQTPDPSLFKGPTSIMEAWGIPAVNTLILLCSGVTITIAHWGVIKDKRTQTLIAQSVTIFLGLLFLAIQMYEYGIAYTEKGLKLSSGIYGTTFFMLTGFHAAHVTIGIIMLSVILYRLFKHDFTPKNHFAFEGVAWYWHFVDVVWLALFIFVYWM